MLATQNDIVRYNIMIININIKPSAMFLSFWQYKITWTELFSGVLKMV